MCLEQGRTRLLIGASIAALLIGASSPGWAQSATLSAVPGDVTARSEFDIDVAATEALDQAVAAAKGGEDPQEAEAPAASVDTGEIIVTARRVGERLRDVPASVAVFDVTTLEQARIKTGKDVIGFTPGVSIVTGADNAGDVQVNIRGLNGARDAENNVALVVDGVLKSSKAALVQNQGTLQQLEVLKGPQGAIYGRNAAAGVFVLTTKKPGDKVEGQFSATAGNNRSYSAYGLVSAPVTRTLGVSVSGDWLRTDGFYRNSFLPSALNQTLYPGNSRNAASVDNNLQWNVYSRALWVPDDNTELDFKFRYGELHGSAINFQAVFQLPAFAAATGEPRFNEDVNTQQPVYSGNIDNLNTQSNLELSLRLRRELPFAELTAYVSYNNFKNRLNADGTSGTFGFFAAEPQCVRTTTALTGYPVQAPFGVGPGTFLPPYSPTTCDGTLYEQHDQKDISAEIRFASKQNSLLQWQFGAYYLNIVRRDCVGLELDTGNGFDPRCYSTNPLTRTEELADDRTDTDVYAGFASLDYAFTRAFKLGFALRYDRESRLSTNLVPPDARTLYVGNVLTGFPNGAPGRPANYFLNAGLDPAYNPSGRLDPRSATFDQFQPKVTASYKFSPGLTAYANWGIGFKSGGFNGGGSSAIINGFFNDTIGAGVNVSETFRKEKTSAFEGGLKGRTLGGKLTYEAAGYYTIVSDQQFFELFVGPFGILREVENIDRVNIAGFEVAATYRIIRGWQLFASYNLTESNIARNTTRPNSIGNRSPTTPNFTINAGSQLNLPLPYGWSFNGRADVRVTGPTYFHVIQDNTVPNIFSSVVGNGNFANTRRGTYPIVNFRAGFEWHNASINGFASNAFNRRNLREIIVAPEFGGAFISPGELRSYGVELGFKF